MIKHIVLSRLSSCWHHKPGVRNLWLWSYMSFFYPSAAASYGFDILHENYFFKMSSLFQAYSDSYILWQ